MRVSRLTAPVVTRHFSNLACALPPVCVRGARSARRLFASGSKNADELMNMELHGLSSLPEFTEATTVAGEAAATTSAAAADDVGGDDRELAFSMFAKELDDLAERDLQLPDLSQFDPERVAEMDAIARKLADRFLGVVSSARGESVDAAAHARRAGAAMKRTVAVMNAENMHRHDLFEGVGSADSANGSGESRVAIDDDVGGGGGMSASDLVVAAAREANNEKTLHDALDNLRGRRRSV